MRETKQEKTKDEALRKAVRLDESHICQWFRDSRRLPLSQEADWAGHLAVSPEYIYRALEPGWILNKISYLFTSSSCFYIYGIPRSSESIDLVNSIVFVNSL